MQDEINALVARLRVDVAAYDGSSGWADLVRRMHLAADHLERLEQENEALREENRWAYIEAALQDQADTRDTLLARAEAAEARVAELEAENGKLRDQVKQEKEENRWAYINAAMEDSDACLEAIARAALERAADVAGNAFVPSDVGGDLICESYQSEMTARAIRAIASDPAELAAIVKGAGE